MDIVKQLIEKHAASFVGPLIERLGFDKEQATRFVPLAVSAVVSVVQGGKLDIASLMGGSGASSLASEVDVGSLAKQADVEPEKARAGLEQMAPGVLDALQSQAGGLDGIASMLGGGQKSGLLGAVGKLFGR